MESTGTRPLTLRKAAEGLKDKEELKRRRTLFKPRKVIGPRDLLVNLNTGKIKIEEPTVQIKTEPGLSSSFDQIQETLENDVVDQLPEDSEESSAESEDDSPNIDNCTCSCSQEIRLLKEAMKEQLKERDLKIQELSDRCRQRDEQVERKLELKDVTIRELSQRVENLERQRSNDSGLSWNTVNVHNKMTSTEGTTNGDLSPASTSGASTSNMSQDNLVRSTQAVLQCRDGRDESLDERVATLFPEVIRIFWGKFAKFRGRDHLNFNCRLVCKAWRKGMDDLLTGDNSPLCMTTQLKLRIWDPRSSINLMNKWLEIENCPFPPRELKLLDSNSSNPALAAYCLEVIGKFLERFGSDINAFTYSIVSFVSREDESLIQWYSTFRSWLVMMPNLQEVTLDDQRTFRRKCLFHEGKRETDSAVRSNPFPIRSNLTSFKVTGSHCSHSVVVSALKGNPHLQKVLLGCLSNPSRDNLPVLLNLTSLDVSTSHLASFDSLRRLKAPLEFLKIHNSSDEVYNLENVLGVVETFDSLKCCSRPPPIVAQ